MRDSRLFPALRVLSFGLLAACVATAGLAPLPSAQAEAVKPVAYKDAAADLETLAKNLKDRKSINDQIKQYLGLVGKAYVHMAPPTKPGDDASEEEKTAYQKALKDFKKDLGDFRKKADSLIFKALTLQRGKKETNERDDVNRLAAQIIGTLGKAYPGKEGAKARGSLAKKLRSTIEKRFKKIKKYDLNTDTLEAAFAALGDLGDISSLQWMLDEYSHSNSKEKDWLVAAHKAMIKFPNKRDMAHPDAPFPKGKMRYEIVESFRKTYAGVENAANTSSNDPKVQAKKRFWDDIKNFTIPVMQHFAQQPKNTETGEALATVAEFEKWLRENKSLKKAPWADPKPTK